MPRKPISADEAARRALEHDWAKRLDTFGKLATTDPDKLSNDDVHDLRVTTRRLRASLWVVRHSMIDAHAERGHRELRSIGEALGERRMWDIAPVSYTHLRAHETPEHLVCRLLLEKK